MKNTKFLEDIKFGREDNVRDIIFKEKFVPLPMVAIDNDQKTQDPNSENIIIQDAIAPVQDNVQEAPILVEANAPVEQTQ